MMILPHVAGNNTVMLKKLLCSPVSVVKNLKAGTSKIHRNSLLPLRTSENCLFVCVCLFVLKKGRGEKKEEERKTTGQEPKF